MQLYKNKQNFLSKTTKNHIFYYPTAKNLTYWWSFGSLAGIFFSLQILTGIFLAMHFSPSTEKAFESIQHIMKNINNGWVIRSLHANGASMTFFCIYIHIAKGLFIRSYRYPKQYLWWTGIVIFVLMMATAFIGYVLPWGQMSFWGATVITNLITAMPIIGNEIAQWIWGGYSIANPTLNRFFSLHYVLPFLITALILIHLMLLHTEGSAIWINNNINGRGESITFSPYFIIKDIFSLFFIITLYSLFVFFYPNLLNHPDNYIEANPLVTPNHIVPEWYFLPFYAILRAIPNKVGGVMYMFGAIVLLIWLPLLTKENYQHISRVNEKRKIMFGFFCFNFILLGFLGGQVAEEPFIILSRVCTTNHFLFTTYIFR